MQIGIKNRGGRKTKRKLIIGAALTAALILVAGCISYDQTMTLNPDGSGTVKIHYTSDDPMGVQLTPVLPFSEEGIIADYLNSEITVREIEIFVPANEEEGTYEATYYLDFLNVADLNGRGIFAVKDHTGTKEAMPQVFTLDESGGTSTFIQKSTLNVDIDDTTGLGGYKFTYSLTCPEVVTMTNGTVESDGCTVNWSYTLPELINNPVKMYAVYGESTGTGQGCIGTGMVPD
jgi:hypothetical protein